MAKRKGFKKFTRTYSTRKRKFIKSRGGYRDQFAAGMRSSTQTRFNRLVAVALNRQISAEKKRFRKDQHMVFLVNKKLSLLQKWGHYDSWASKQLISRLDTSKLKLISKDGLIDYKNLQYLNKTQLAYMEKAIQQFLNSKTSTIQGINAVIKRQRQHLIEKTDNIQFVKSLTNREIETLYKVYDEESFNYLSDKVKYEIIFDTIVQARQDNFTAEEFADELSYYMDPNLMNDDDVLDAIAEIYAKYIENE